MQLLVCPIKNMWVISISIVTDEGNKSWNMLWKIFIIVCGVRWDKKLALGRYRREHSGRLILHECSCDDDPTNNRFWRDQKAFLILHISLECCLSCQAAKNSTKLIQKVGHLILIDSNFPYTPKSLAYVWCHCGVLHWALVLTRLFLEFPSKYRLRVYGHFGRQDEF